MNLRRLLRHGAVIVFAFGLIALASASAGQRSPLFATNASAVVGGNIEIAPAAAGPWASSLDGIWVLANARPGDSVTGSARLRTLNITNPGATGFFVQALTGATPIERQLASALVVTEMKLDATDLLPYWASCTGGVTTVRDLETCVAPSLPLPAGGAGSLFTMTLQFDPGAGNDLQAATTTPGFVFLVVDETAATPSPSPSPSTTPTGTVTPSVTPSPSQTVTPTATASPTGTSTPPSTSTSTPPGGGGPAPSATATPTAPGEPTAPASPPTSATPGTPGPGASPSSTPPGPLPTPPNIEELQGDFTLLVVVPDGVPQDAFTFTVGGDPGSPRIDVSGPRTVLIDGAPRPLDLANVVCISDTRGRVEVPTSRTVVIPGKARAERITCTWTFSLSAGPVPPRAPDTGSGLLPGSVFGLGMATVGAVLILNSALVFVAAGRRRRQGDTND